MLFSQFHYFVPVARCSLLQKLVWTFSQKEFVGLPLKAIQPHQVITATRLHIGRIVWRDRIADFIHLSTRDPVLFPASSPVFPGGFWRDVSRKACWENSPRTPGNKRQIQHGGARPCVQHQPRKHISFPPPTTILKRSGVMYVTYTYEIFPDPRCKKQVFAEQYLGLFVAELGLFCHFVQAFPLSRSVPSLLLSHG